MQIANKKTMQIRCKGVEKDFQKFFSICWKNFTNYKNSTVFWFEKTVLIRNPYYWKPYKWRIPCIGFKNVGKIGDKSPCVYLCWNLRCGFFGAYFLFNKERITYFTGLALGANFVLHCLTFTIFLINCSYFIFNQLIFE